LQTFLKCHDSLENVAGIDAFKVVSLPVGLCHMKSLRILLRVLAALKFFQDLRRDEIRG